MTACFFVFEVIVIKELEDKILKEGQVLPGNVLKVGSFLNQQIDIDILMKMGAEIARLYADSGVNKILTVEASGIAVAVAAANFLKTPIVFAKKSRSSNVTGEVYSAKVESFTHGTVNNIIVSKDFLKRDDRVLIVDDFLANGNALVGLSDIVRDAGATIVGAAVAIEKGFQKGGDDLRAKGMRIESLAIIDNMSDGEIVFRQQ